MFANVQKDGSTVANEIARLYGQNAQAFFLIYKSRSGLTVICRTGQFVIGHTLFMKSNNSKVKCCKNLILFQFLKINYSTGLRSSKWCVCRLLQLLETCRDHLQAECTIRSSAVLIGLGEASCEAMRLGRASSVKQRNS